MSGIPTAVLTTPHIDDLGLTRIANRSGLSIAMLPNGAVFSLEHAEGDRRIVINQTYASPIAGGMGRLFLRIGGVEPATLACAGAEASGRVGGADDRFVWEGTQRGRNLPGHSLARSGFERLAMRASGRESRRNRAAVRTLCSSRISASAIPIS